MIGDLSSLISLWQASGKQDELQQIMCVGNLTQSLRNTLQLAAHPSIEQLEWTEESE